MGDEGPLGNSLPLDGWPRYAMRKGISATDIFSIFAFAVRYEFPAFATANAIWMQRALAGRAADYNSPRCHSGRRRLRAQARAGHASRQIAGALLPAGGRRTP